MHVPLLTSRYSVVLLIRNKHRTQIVFSTFSLVSSSCVLGRCEIGGIFVDNGPLSGHVPLHDIQSLPRACFDLDPDFELQDFKIVQNVKYASGTSNQLFLCMLDSCLLYIVIVFMQITEGLIRNVTII